MYITSSVRRSWVEIDLEQIKKNYTTYRDAINAGTKVIPVVKADGYGHGDVPVCKKLALEGADLFAVSNVEEAITLRKGGVEGDILILGYTPIESLPDVFEYDIIQTLPSKEYADLVIESGINVKCQFAIDTGMNRIGLNTDDMYKTESVIREYSKKLKLLGFFTHLCVADSDEEDNISYTKKQISLFDELVSRTSDLKFPYTHSMNSAGGIFYNSHNASKFVRLGITLYGLKPDYSNKLPDGIEPALSWKSVISMIKKVPEGASIGYGRTYKTEREMWIATIPTGYADGYRRDLSNRGFVLLRGRKARIVGRICMDQFMIDVTELVESGENINIGDEVILLGRDGDLSFSADDMANMIGTIGHEIVCGISKRVPRLYIG